jgi:hypothetical protein
MTDAELLQHVTDRLRAAGIEFMVVGSVASSYHGEPRFTHDIDVVIDATEEQLMCFVASFEGPFYVSEVAARDAFRRRSMFNIIHPDCEFKADIIVAKGRDFDKSQFARRQPGRISGVAVDVASPEDIILAKLQWGVRADSEQQYKDAVGVAKACGAELDVPYLRRWAEDLRVVELLERLLRDAEMHRA